VEEEWAAAAAAAVWAAVADRDPSVVAVAATEAEDLVPVASASVPDAAQKCLIRGAKSARTLSARTAGEP